MTTKSKIYAAFCLVVFASVALAHDYWILPERFFVPPGGATALHLYVGERLVSEEERPFQKNPTERFEILHGENRKDLIATSQDGQSPLVSLKDLQSGNHLVVIERRPQGITLAPEKFTAYLKEEGLTSIIVERKQRRESKQPGRERYSRYLKSLLQVGDERGTVYQRVVGLRLEIVLLKNPYALSAGADLQAQVLFEGRPLENAEVKTYSKAKGRVHSQTRRTDGEGKVNFKLDRSGDWLIRLVHMRRCASDCGETNWESFWASYSFGMR